MPKEETARRTPQYITVIDDGDIIPYRMRDEESGVLSESVIQVKPLNENLKAAILKRHTRSKIRRGIPVDLTDWKSYTADVLDEAIIEWDKVLFAGTKKPVPCTRENKSKLPDMVRAEIMRIAAGREVPRDVEEESSKNASETTSSGSPTAE